MSRGSFGRSVARAAASGGGRAYGSRPPFAWYALMLVIVAAGVSLIVYSRNERIHPASATKTIGPTTGDHWQDAYAIDICGTVEPALAANSNLSSVGIRTFGNGLIDINPGALKSGSSKYTGAKATLGLFASSYPSFTLTGTSIKLPGKKATTYANGDSCPATSTEKAGKGTLQAWVWSSTTAKRPREVSGNLTSYHLTNGAMITIAFVPKGATIPVPPSKSALVTALGSAS